MSGWQAAAEEVRVRPVACSVDEDPTGTVRQREALPGNTTGGPSGQRFFRSK